VENAAGTPYDILNDPEFDLLNGASLNLYVQWATAGYYGGDENGRVLGQRLRDDGVTVQAIQDLNFRDTAYALRMYLGAIQDVAVPVGDGRFDVTFFRALPADFTGDVVIGMGGSPAFETTDADGVTDFENAAPVSAVYFPGTPRVAAFDSAKCNACHNRIMEHGGTRNGNAEFCLMCHNGDAAVCPGDETFELDNPEVTPGWSHVHFPQQPQNCENACHTRDASNNPLWNVARATARAVSTDHGADIRRWGDDTATTPNAAVCGVCHTSTAARGHFVTQGAQVDEMKCTIVGADCTGPNGGTGLPNGQEACAVCHGTGAEFETAKEHPIRDREGTPDEAGFTVKIATTGTGCLHRGAPLSKTRFRAGHFSGPFS
jgi:hypothetical protein